MLFRHCDFAFSVPDDWWRENEMAEFVPADLSYVAGTPEREREGLPVFTVAIAKVVPCPRNLSHGQFNDRPGRSAKQAVAEIFHGFRNREAIPPVEIVKLPIGAEYEYRLEHGAHRFYCAVAAGFSHVPAVDVSRAMECDIDYDHEGKSV
jgi:hypothetical protein